VSPQLAYNLHEFQHTVSLKKPKEVQPIEIKYSTLKSVNVIPNGVGAFFSGGVDSLYTLWEHLPQNQPIPDYQVTHGLFMLGFDLGLNKRQKFTALFSQYQKALKGIGVEVVPIETNLVSILLPHMEFTSYYGSIQAGCAQVLGRFFKRFYLPSSRDYEQLAMRVLAGGPLTDRLLSTDTLDLIHHGATCSRVEKVQMISDWEIAQQNLRVCGNPEYVDTDMNCSRCEKCVRTMIPIYALGKMDEFKTFAKPLKNNWEGLWWARKFSPRLDYSGEMVPFIKKYKKDFAPWIRLAIVLGFFRYWALKSVPMFLRRRLKPFGYFVDTLMEEYDYEDLEVIDTIRENAEYSN
jgi:hypothetical protein